MRPAVREQINQMLKYDILETNFPHTKPTVVNREDKKIRICMRQISLPPQTANIIWHKYVIQKCNGLKGIDGTQV